MEEKEVMDDNNTTIEIEIPHTLFEKLSSNDCSIQSMCRICLSTGNEILYSLAPDSEGNLLADMFTTVTSINISSDDGLPSSICTSCQGDMINCYQFQAKCLKSEYLLRSILKGVFCTKNDSNESKEITTTINDSVVLENTETVVYDINNDVTDDGAVCDAQENEKTETIITEVPEPVQEIQNQKTSKDMKHYSCNHCSKKFHKIKSLKNHIKQKHSNKEDSLTCKQCNEIFICTNDLKLHEILHTKGPVWKCTQCGKEFQVKTTLRRHLLRHMESKRIPCDFCGKTFAERCALVRHRRTHTGEQLEKKHVCDICDKRFSDKCQLTCHMTHHGGAKPCVCACGKKFASQRLLASHRRIHSDDKPYACQYCDKRFRHESTRNTHHRTHTGERPYVCSVCGKTFIQNSNMTLHMRSHTGERPYSCSICDSKFTTGWSLKLHERSHTGIKPYSCNICGKSFARMNMKAHMRLHTGDKPHACTVCPKRFNNASNLRDHCRLHTGERPYECALCPDKFPTKSHLIKHVRRHEKTKFRKGLSMYRPRTKKPKEVTVVQNPPIVQSILGLCGTETSMEVGQELMLQDDGDMKTEVILLDNSQNLANGITFAGDDASNDVNLLTVNEEGVSISSSAMMEGNTMKLYQVDQSLLQIHRKGTQLTISKITSKMTANF